jgi:superfamily I DNA/RNA helicase
MLEGIHIIRGGSVGTSILAARRSKKKIGMSELQDSIERVALGGPERRSRVMTDRKKLVVAYHMQPNNDFLGYRLSKIVDGEEIAGNIRRKASEQFTTINDIRFKIVSMTMDQIPSRLARFKVSDDSIALVRAKMASLGSFSDLSDLMMALNTEDTEQIGHGVTVGTMHAAKGREWNTVFLPSFEQAIVPGDRKSMVIEEERRLAYVAITRARHDLIISWCKTRTPEFGSRQPKVQEPSQFLHEMSYDG